MKEIKLTQGKVALVDDDDYILLNQYKWQAYKHGYTYYAKRSSSRINGKRKNIIMHRIILGITDPKLFTDHKDRNGLHNCKNNLRVSTHSENMANRVSHKDASSKYLGVSLLIQKRKDRIYTYWISQIQKDKRLIFLGLFKDEVEAAIAYNKKAIEIHGEWANLNNI